MSLTRVTGNVVQDASLPESKLISPYVDITGDTMTGALNLPSDGLVVGSNQLVVSGGKIGVGLANPTYTLDVSGNFRVTGSFLSGSLFSAPSISLSYDGTSGTPALYFNNEVNTGIFRSGSGTFAFTSAGATSAYFNSSRFYTTSGVFSYRRAGSVDATDNALEYNSASDTLFIGRDSANINIRAAGSNNRIVIDNTGRVGINTSPTTNQFTVGGRIFATNGYQGLLLNDLPTVTTIRGGTGLTAFTAGNMLYYSSGTAFTVLSGAINASFLTMTNNVPAWVSFPVPVVRGGTGVSAAPTNGQILIGNGTTFTLNRILTGAGITVVNGAGTISVGATGIPNASLQNSTFNVLLGAGLSGSALVGLGQTLSIYNTGITQIFNGVGITSTQVGSAITITNAGVTNITGGSGVAVSANTGNVNVSLNPNGTGTLRNLILNQALSPLYGGTGLSQAPGANQILYGNGTTFDLLTVQGVGVTISPDFTAKTLTFQASLTGVTVANLVNGNSYISIPQPNGSIFGAVQNSLLFTLNNAFNNGTNTVTPNIGIGTTIPSYKIDFGQSLSTGGTSVARAISLYNQPSSFIFTGIGLTPTPSVGIRVAGTPTVLSSTGTVADLGYYGTDINYAWTSVMMIRNDSRVGINNPNPNYALDVIGDVSSSNNIRLGTGGTFALTTVNDITTTTTALAVLDTFLPTQFRSAKYLVQVFNTNTSNYQTSEVLVIHNGTSAFLTEYAQVDTGGVLGIMDADIIGGNVRLTFTPTNANNRIRVHKTLIGIS